MKNKAKGWYHDSRFGDTDAIVYFETEPVWKAVGNWYGPHKTAAACKKDAIAYHEVDINRARKAIRDIKKMKGEKW